MAQDGASNEDDITVKLTEIVFTNALIKQGITKGAPISQFMVRPYPRHRFVPLTTFIRNNGNFFRYPLRCISIQNYPVFLPKWVRNQCGVSARDSRESKVDSGETFLENVSTFLVAR